MVLFVATQASGDYVGTLTNRIIFDAENSADVFDGYHVGDIVAFIGETTPAPTGDRGIAAWSTIYIPPGVRVVGAELVSPDGDGTYSKIPAKDVAAAHDDCGNRGCAFPTTGTYQNGRVNEVQQDTGVFYSADPQTALLASPLNANPTGVANQSVYNTWDYNQVRAFGDGGAFSGNGGKGNTPVVQIGGTWFGTGSPVAGASTYYQKDYDPTCDPGTGTSGADFRADLGCTGPWQRIAYPNGKIGGSGVIVPATTGAAAPLVNTAVPTAAGYDFATSGALAATTNSLRFVQGIRRLGDLETARVYFVITDPVAFKASFSNSKFCLDGTGGDLDKGDITDPGRRGAQDNPWRYYEGNTHQCYFGSADGFLLKAPEFVNGVPSSGLALAQNDIVGYKVTFQNTTANTLFDIDFSDLRIANLDLVAAGTAGCPYANYNGNRAGLPTLNTLNATTATWNRLDSLPAGQSVTVHICGRVTAGGTGSLIQNRGAVAFATVDGGAQQNLTSTTTGVVASRIEGRLFEDTDGNNNFSAGDTPEAGVTVRLYTNNGGSPGTLLATTTTNGTGLYQFSGFPNGSYIVVAEDPPGYTSIRDIDTVPPCTGNACNEIAVNLNGNVSKDNNFLDRAPVRITGTVFGDQNADGTFNLGDRDFGQAGVTVRLFRDANNDGIADSGTPEATLVTGANGSYQFLVGNCNLLINNCHFVLDIVTATLPAGATLTTDNFEEADFTAFGQTDANNNFGFTAPPTIQLGKTSSGAGTDIFPGDTVTYTLRPRNADSKLLTNARVTDSVPPRTTFVGATPVGFTGPAPVAWNLGSNSPGTSGSFTPTAVTVTGHPADQGTYIDEDNPDANDGADAKINLKTDSGKRIRGLVQWNLTSLGIPAGSAVTSAELSFYVTDNKTITASVHRLNRSWVEGTGNNATGADWESPNDNGNPPTITWTAPGGTGDYTAAAVGSFSLAVKNVRPLVPATALVQGWVNTPATNFGVILLPSGANGEAKIGSDDNAEPPRLNLTYVPPGSTTTSLAATGTLVGGGEAITLTLTVRANASDALVTPPAPVVTGALGAGATCGGGWTPASQALTTTAGTFGQITFTRVCTATAGSLGGNVRFNLAAPTGSRTYSASSSNTVLVAPNLTMTVRLDNPLVPWVPQFTNTATFSSDGTFDVMASARDVVSRGGTVGDRVWLDVDGDGVQDIGEPGIGNVEVTLYNAGLNGVPGGGDDVAIATARTGADGQYFFTHLRPGTYFVDVTNATVPAGLTLSPGSTDPSATVTVTAEEIFLGLDFGYRNADPANAVIGDQVWSDDGDGVLEPGEVGIGGVLVELIGAGPDGILGTPDDVVVQTKTTAADGSYLFTGVAAGSYRVRVNKASSPSLTGYTFQSGPQSPGNPTAPITVAGGDAELGADFAYVNPAAFPISDRVWLDVDGDGVQDPGELGISGVTVNLVDLGADQQPGGGDDTVIGTAITNASGDFVFNGVTSGDYALQVTDTSGALTGLSGTTQPGLDFFLDLGPVNAATSAVSFGYNAPGTIGDLVWSDADGDGVRDPGEPGLGGVTVVLWQDADGNGVFDSTVDTQVKTTTTAADGSYLFEGLLPATFFVSVNDGQPALAGFTPTTTDQETGGQAAGTQIEVVLAGLASSFLNADFGYRNAALPNLSGNVFHDIDRDGLDDGAGEPGIGGVTLTLIHRASGLVVATTTTDANGDYSFLDVSAGDYSVAVTDDGGVLEGYKLTSGLDAIDVTVAAADITDLDFGYARDSATGSIGDQVWLDGDGNGVKGGTETGLSGVVLRLYEDDGDGIFGGGDALIAQTTTDANGGYVFPGLPAGNYFVDLDAATLPSGGAGLATTVGTTDPSRLINLSEGGKVVDADFGYVPTAGTAILGDRVWNDADGDGLQDPGETGIPGVTITVDGPSLGSPISVVTDAAGRWLVPGLAPGDYTVDYDPTTLPAGFSPIPTNTGGEPTYNVTLAAGNIFLHLDYGFTGGPTGSIGDLVYFDADGNGAFGGGDSGVADVTVDLIDHTTNQVIATTTTGPAGGYDFTGLAAGTYRVRVTDVGGVLAGLNPTQTAPSPISLAAGQDYNLADFGYAPSGGVGSIGSVLWHDENGNGLRGAGEDGIQGVTVDLWRDVDQDGIITPGIDNLLRSVATDENGEYEFAGLLFDRYLVTVTDRAGVLGGFTKTTGPVPGANDNSQADPYAVLLNSGSPTNITADFGWQAAGTPHRILGTVFEDDNPQDGLYDSINEFGVKDVELLLYRIVGGQQYLIGRTTAAVDGSYAFDNLPNGQYRVAAVTRGSLVDGFVQTTQTGTGGTQPVTLAGADNPDNDFGFFNGGVTTTPVTLAHFSSESLGGSVRFTWITATEVGNVAFNLHAFGEQGWRLLNEEPIPSRVVDSIEPQQYQLEVAVEAGESFLLEDIDVLGRSRYHGPFEVDRSYGEADLGHEAIDWQTVRSEHEQARRQAADDELLSLSDFAKRGPKGPSAVYLRVERDGVYRVTYEALAAAGLDLTKVQANKLELSAQGQPVPLRVISRGSFGPGDAIEFVGQALDTLYTRTQVYTLTVDGQGGGKDKGKTRVETDKGKISNGAVAPDFYLEELRLETDRSYSPLAPGEDPWFDAFIFTFGSRASTSITAQLEGWLPGAAPVTMEAQLWGGTAMPEDPDHHVIFQVNGEPVADELFDGQVERTLGGEVPDWVLAPSNQLEVVLPGDTGASLEMVMTDAYRIVYPRRFEARQGRLRFTAAGEAFQVQGLPTSDVVVYRSRGQRVESVERIQVSGSPGAYEARFRGTAEAATYWVVSAEQLLTPEIVLVPAALDPAAGAAELLVISHPDFVPGLERLVDHRRAQGWDVRVVDTETLYSQFGHGVFGPQAIRDFLATAARELGTTHVLLVGGDTYDYHDALGQGSMSFLPSIYAATGELVRHAPADSLYTDLDGDQVPDLAIGRFPVRTSAELEAMIDKTLAYEATAAAPRAVVAADGYDAGAGFSFALASEQLAALIPQSWGLEEIYVDELGVTQARADLLAEMNGGPSLVSYMGHSGTTSWSFSGLFTANDATALTNSGRPMVVTQWGCWTTYYVVPSYNTLGHKLLLSGDRGAAAVLGATTLTEARSERILGRQIYQRAFVPGATLGQVLRDAKRQIAGADAQAARDVVLGWTLLGDPTLSLVPTGFHEAETQP